MKGLYHGIGLMVAFCLLFTVLITSVEAVVYWNTGYFEKQYRKYDVLEKVHMEMEDLLYVTEEMMAYLKDEREDLKILTVVGGEERFFFNEKETRHMVDVQGLFLKAMQFRRMAVGFLMLFGGLLLWKKQEAVLWRMLQWGIGLLLGSMAGLALLISTDFTKYFTCFHLIFFDNDDWILNPKTDLLINIVPEGFFRDTAFLIAGVFLTTAAVLWLLAAFLYKRAEKRAEKQRKII